MARRVLVGLVVCLLLITGLSGDSVLTPHLDWIGEAATQIREGRYTSAETVYKRAMERTPEDAGPALYLARLYAEWGQPQRGLIAVDEAVDRGAQEDLVRPLRFDLLAQTERWTQLRFEARQQLSHVPTDPKAWQALTIAALHQGDCAAATESVIGWINTESSRPAEALYFLAVLSADPDRLARFAPELHQRAFVCGEVSPSCIGHALVRQGFWAHAICPLRQAIRLDPQDSGSHAWLGEALTRNDLHAEAESHLLEAVRLAPNDPLPWLLLGKHYLNLGETSAARRSLLNAQALDPANPAPCLAIAELKAQASAYEEIQTWADAALERAPDDAEVWKAVARLYLERNLITDRYPLWAAEGAVRMEPEDGEAHMLLGWAHLQSERTQDALLTLKKSTELAPYSGEAHFWLAQALEASGSAEQAEQALTRAANLGYISGR